MFVLFDCAQLTANLNAIEDPEEVAKQQAKLVVEAVASLDAYTLNDQGPIKSYESPASTRAIIFELSDIVARLARERQGIQHGVVW